MSDFQYGPFAFEASEKSLLSGVPSRRWTMVYGSDALADKILPESATRAQIVDAFDSARAAFVGEVQPASPPREDPLAHGYEARLVYSTDVTGMPGQVLDRFLVLAPIPGIRRGLLSDNHETWLHVPEFDGILPMGAEEFARIKAAHEALKDALLQVPLIAKPAAPLAWVQALLSDEVLTENSDEWQAPTTWQIRHVVGQGSFTGATGAQAAALVGVSPQNFRKYLAPQGAKQRQHIGYSMWHLLLHKLGVKPLGN